jgi:hypothetical protein
VSWASSFGRLLEAAGLRLSLRFFGLVGDGVRGLGAVGELCSLLGAWFGLGDACSSGSGLTGVAIFESYAMLLKYTPRICGGWQERAVDIASRGEVTFAESIA